MNLKGWKLVKFGNQGVGMQRSLNLNLKGLKMNKIRKSRCWGTKKTWKLGKLGNFRVENEQRWEVKVSQVQRSGLLLLVLYTSRLRAVTGE